MIPTVNALHAAGLHLVAAGSSTGVFDLVNSKVAEAKTATISVGGLIALIFIVRTAWVARGAIAGIIIGAVAAAVFLWILSNVGALQGRVGNEVNGFSSSTSVARVIAAPPHDRATSPDAS